MIMGCSEAVGDTSRLTSINGKLPWFTSSKRKVAVVHWSQFGLATGGECTQLCERFYMTVCVNFIACDNIYIITFERAAKLMNGPCVAVSRRGPRGEPSPLVVAGFCIRLKI